MSNTVLLISLDAGIPIHIDWRISIAMIPALKSGQVATNSKCYVTVLILTRTIFVS
jgi:hypothetical protein